MAPANPPARDDVVPLDAVLATSRLAERLARAPDHVAENRALHAVVQALAGSTEAALDTLLHEAIALCRPDGDATAGVSLLERDPTTGEPFFRWIALVGRLADRVGDTIPYTFSACGVCLGQRKPVLFERPDRRFPHLRATGAPFVEKLVLPFEVDGLPIGTIWVASHDATRAFDREDVRVLASLASVAGAVYTLVDARRQRDVARDLAEYRSILTDALRPLDDAGAVRATAARVLGVHLGASRVHYGEVAPDDQQMRVTEDYVAPSSAVPHLTGPFRMEAFGPMVIDALRAGRTLIISNVATDDGLAVADRAAYERVGVTAMVCVPLVKSGRLEGVLVVHQSAPRDWTPGEVALIEETAERTWSALRRAQAERALRESEAQYRTLFQLLDDGFCVVQMLFDADGRPVDYRFIATNASFEGQTGLVNAAGRTARELVPTLEEHWFEIYGRVATTGEPTRFENGSEPMGRWFDVYACRIGDPAAHHVAIVFRDTSAAKQSTRERERLLRAAESANKAKSEFLATMSHEIRTPINAIQGYAELLDLGIGGDVTAVQRDYISRLATAGRHLLGLVNDVLDLAKVDAGEMTAARLPIAADDVVRAAFDLTRPQAGARGIHLVEPPSETGVAFVGDEHRVRQILVNLLSNAVKFTNAGGRVTVAVDETPHAPAAQVAGAGPWVRIRVADTGIGIVPEELGPVFEPFHQVEQGRTRLRGGTGLGLAISRRLARLMGGDLTVESTLGAGSVFTLWLPAVAEAAGEATPTALAGTDEATTRPAGEAPSAPGARRASSVVRGLSDIGAGLRASLDAVLAEYGDRMRAEGGVALAQGMAPASLEDHLGAFVADLAQSLVLVEESGREGVDMIGDSAVISRVIADRHGARRAAQGWDEAAVRRDYEVLERVVARTLRDQARVAGTDPEAGVAVVRTMLERAAGIALEGWRAARRERESR